MPEDSLDKKFEQTFIDLFHQNPGSKIKIYTEGALYFLEIKSDGIHISSDANTSQNSIPTTIFSAGGLNIIRVGDPFNYKSGNNYLSSASVTKIEQIT